MPFSRQSTGFVSPPVVAAALLAALAACESSSTGPAEEAPVDRIVFISNRDSASVQYPDTPERHVYVMGVDGSNVRKLMETEAQYRNLRLSPDGTRMLFTSNAVRCLNTWVMSFPDSTVTQLTGTETGERCNIGARWSPDGSMIAYHSSNDPEDLWEVWVMNADGTGKNPVSNDPGTDYVHGWTPDGRVVFASDRDGGEHAAYYAVNPDGTGLERLFEAYGYLAPHWSPDGTKIAALKPDLEGKMDVWVANADGTGGVNVTESPEYETFPRYAADIWSPDGSRIVYSAVVDGSKDLFIADADGTGATPLVTGPGSVDFYTWSPDGSRIVYSAIVDGSEDLFIADADGSDPVNLTDTLGEDFEARWLPAP